MARTENCNVGFKVGARDCHSLAGSSTLPPVFLNMLSLHPDQVFDVQDVRKSMNLTGRAYQKRSVTMIRLFRLFLGVSSKSNRDQVDALKM